MLDKILFEALILLKKAWCLKTQKYRQTIKGCVVFCLLEGMQSCLSTLQLEYIGFCASALQQYNIRSCLPYNLRILCHLSKKVPFHSVFVLGRLQTANVISHSFSIPAVLFARNALACPTSSNIVGGVSQHSWLQILF